MKIRNESLYVTMKAYVLSALEFVAARAKQEQGSSGGGDFDFYWVLTRYSGVLSEVSQYEGCLTELTRDDEIMKHLNQNVGSYSRGTLTPTVENMMRHVLDLGRRNGCYDFDRERFDREYQVLEQTYYSEALLCEAIAPLQGLLLEIPLVRLSQDVEISQLEEEEMKPYRAAHSHWDGRWCAVRVKYQLPKVIGGKECEDRFVKMEAERAIEEVANERIAGVVNALRLMGKCDVYHSGIIHQTPKWLYIQDHSVANRVLGTGFINYSMGERDAEFLQSLWGQLELPQAKKGLDVAVRRFGDSCVRNRNEDKIIDLMIAAEALFLGGQRVRNKSKGLASRAGELLSLDPNTQKQISDHMLRAYKLRNAVVHEGHFGEVLESGDGTVDEFISKTQGYLQSGIFKSIDIPSIY